MEDRLQELEEMAAKLLEIAPETTSGTVATGRPKGGW